MKEFKCYKCECIIDNIVNNDIFSKPATDKTIYICDICVEIENDKKVKWPGKAENEIICDLNNFIKLPIAKATNARGRK